MAKGKFTAVGVQLWNWKPFRDLESLAARMVWLALYTTAEGKRILPGLWQGSVYALAEASSMRPDDVLVGLDILIERGLVEYDQDNRLMRLTELPDAHERACNGRMIRGWWNRFQTLPDCPLRNAHIRTLWWLLEQEPMTKDHHEAWQSTFAAIIVPAVRRRGVRSLRQGETAQRSLFEPRDSSTLPVVLPNELPTTEYEIPSASSVVETVSSGASSVGAKISDTTEHGVVCESVNPNENNNSGYRIETVSHTVGDGDGDRVRFHSSSPDSGAGSTGDRGTYQPTPTPHLALVPPRQPVTPPGVPNAHTVHQVIVALTGYTRPLPPEVQNGVQEAISRTFGPAVPPERMEDLRAFRAQMGSTPALAVLQFVRTGSGMAEAIERGAAARAEKARVSAEKSKYLSELRSKAGV